MFDDRNFAIQLIDFYSNLLTEHQRTILADYYMEDLSMQEIAENHTISRAAVSDLIKRSMHQLQDYEDKLKLIEVSNQRNAILEQMQLSDDENVVAYADKLKELE